MPYPPSHPPTQTPTSSTSFEPPRSHPPTHSLLPYTAGRTVTGEFTALMGPSGAGKTTLMDCIALRQRKFEGAIHVDGKSPKSDYFTQTGYVHQKVKQRSPTHLPTHPLVSFSSIHPPTHGLPAAAASSNRRLVLLHPPTNPPTHLQHPFNTGTLLLLLDGPRAPRLPLHQPFGWEVHQGPVPEARRRGHWVRPPTHPPTHPPTEFHSLSYFLPTHSFNQPTQSTNSFNPPTHSLKQSTYSFDQLTHPPTHPPTPIPKQGGGAGPLR